MSYCLIIKKYIYEKIKILNEKQNTEAADYLNYKQFRMMSECYMQSKYCKEKRD